MQTGDLAKMQILILNQRFGRSLRVCISNKGTDYALAVQITLCVAKVLEHSGLHARWLMESAWAKPEAGKQKARRKREAGT